jgi:hypothetical protein
MPDWFAAPQEKTSDYTGRRQTRRLVGVMKEPWISRIGGSPPVPAASECLLFASTSCQSE